MTNLKKRLDNLSRARSSEIGIGIGMLIYCTVIASAATGATDEPLAPITIGFGVGLFSISVVLLVADEQLGSVKALFWVISSVYAILLALAGMDVGALGVVPLFRVLLGFAMVAWVAWVILRWKTDRLDDKQV